MRARKRKNNQSMTIDVMDSVSSSRDMAPFMPNIHSVKNNINFLHNIGSDIKKSYTNTVTPTPKHFT